jgi:hypothetical protein
VPEHIPMAISDGRDNRGIFSDNFLSLLALKNSYFRLFVCVLQLYACETDFQKADSRVQGINMTHSRSGPMSVSYHVKRWDKAQSGWNSSTLSNVGGKKFTCLLCQYVPCPLFKCSVAATRPDTNGMGKGLRGTAKMRTLSDRIGPVSCLGSCTNSPLRRSLSIPTPVPTSRLRA